ncbi:non-hydrolyzing UDP-N-acetylglucosamine 2-epimerase [Glycomyces sp. NRRL B-16210]|uniref:non-hydrolyzing UDP-N-acetylglucosamine 2-epimerase n=1 Tax=Glycomyces sp. NRRL B-16210 TaxID=1463821 RepID=UPI00042E49A5|nr:UDP-N-acetylglucosamine 2-epimerase (non-hydrolyzing) [Glycomyces sp. NRRL B-16210]AHL24470.1 UDP-N-acetylglucosamine 2-epimerase [Glycomyces sp. NRRL B-16210]
MKVLSIVGARPQLVKLGAVAKAFKGTGHEHLVLHTGQHYDPALSEVFFTEFAIPWPDFHLGVGSGGHGEQTGAMLAAIDPVLERERPDWVLVYGDTNSTIAGALAAVKLHLKVAHLEAGLRSFNRRMPEEHNRVLTDHCADLLLAPTATAVRHLETEGLGDRAVLVGDVMTDVCFATRDAVLAREERPALPEGIDPGAPFLVATLHRAENTDDPERLAALLQSLAALPVPVLLAVHPRLRAKAAAHGIAIERGAIVPCAPLPYSELVAAVLASSGVVTDSGGLQKEAYLLERPCTTLRTETEWVETLEDGWNALVPHPDRLPAGEWHALAARPAPSAPTARPYGRGRAGAAVVEVLAEHLGTGGALPHHRSGRLAPQGLRTPLLAKENQA